MAIFMGGDAQVVSNPIFLRSDNTSFRINKIEIAFDTTYVYCSYYANKNSWANISKETFVENTIDGTKKTILKALGLPFSPERRLFDSAAVVPVMLVFPNISSEEINIIEDAEDNSSFNIYGIKLKQKRNYDRVYTDSDVDSCFYSAKAEEESKNWELAIGLYQKQLEASAFLYGEQSKECAWAMFNILLDYSELGKYEDGIEMGNKIIGILNEYPQDSLVIDVLARTYGSVSSFYTLLNKDDEASRYREKSIFLRRMKPEVGTVSYEEYLLNTSKIYYYNGDFPKALLYGKELVDICRKKYLRRKKEYGCSYAIVLCNLCEFYQRMEQFKDAVETGSLALEIIENGECDDSQVKYLTYINLGGALSSIGKKDEAISYLKYVVDASNNVDSPSDRLLINSRMLLADILLGKKEKRDTLNAIKEYNILLQVLEDSIALGRPQYSEYTELLHKLYLVHRSKNDSLSKHYLYKCVQFVKGIRGENSIEYANLLIQYIRNFLIIPFPDKKEWNNVLSLLRQSSDIVKRHINNTIYNMSKSERSLYWKRYSGLFTWMIPAVCELMCDIDEANSLAYDASLFYKGMLLSSEKEFRDVIISSKDSILNNLYIQYTQNLYKFERLYTTNSSSFELDSLQSAIKNEEFVLSQKVSSFNRLYKGTDVSWKDVRDQLNDGDVAIEIVTVDSNNQDAEETYYDVYMINNKSETPIFAFLFEEKELKEIIESDIIDYNMLSRMIWGNTIVCDFIKEAKNIYFSTSGLLNNIGIEYLPIDSGRSMNDCFNMYRLFSTRELCMQHEKKSMENVCLYGGLDYNNEKSTNHNILSTGRLTRSIVASIVERGGFEPLAGSKEEIEQIRKELENNNIHCITFTGSKGTEESLKDLSGRQIDIIHLSTHGMFVELEDSEHTQSFSFVFSDGDMAIDEEDQILSHSFLVMSGGNKMMISGNEIIGDDGILTALDVSHLDFSNLDLVVLSACQTALGKVESEGVYGLQRGFKKAGANTILMSLDKVDDEATKILMVEFYKNLMSGKTKHQSLKDAQKHLRQVDNGKYDDPKYWASFIMLDGLN